MEQPAPIKKILKSYYPEDIIAVVFSSVIIFILGYYIQKNAIKDVSSIILPSISLLLLIILICFREKSQFKTLRFLRSYIHIPLYGIIFGAFQQFIHILNPNDYDHLLLKADYNVFGFDITRWFEPFISRPITELLTLSYFSYYLLPSVTFILLFFAKEPSAFSKARLYLLSIIIGWYGAFIFYLVLPAAGPDIAFPENYSVPLQGLTPLTNFYLASLGTYLRESFVRNTFPSMHFAIILITNYFAFRFKKKYFYFCTLPLGLLLAAATVYLRQHYLIDLAGSVPAAVLSIFLSAKLINSSE